MEILLLSLSGIGVGVLSSFFGIGGGILIVPTLEYLYSGLLPSNIISTSLGIIFIASTINCQRYFKEKSLPPKKLIMIIALACLLGALTGSFLVPYFSKSMMRVIFGLILTLVSLHSFYKIYLSPKKDIQTSEVSSNISLFTLTFFGAILSSLTGLGGGVIFVPMFLYLLKLSSKIVPIFSNVCMLFATFFGVLPHIIMGHDTQNLYSTTQFPALILGNMSLEIILIMFVGMKVGSILGNASNSKVKPRTKTILLSTLVLFIGIKSLITSF